MDEIRVNKVNRYTSRIDINNQTFFIRDRDKIMNDRKRYRKIGRNLQNAAVIVGMLAALYILGIVGHSDFVTEAHIEDTWDTVDYIVRIFGGACVIGIAYLMHRIGEWIRQMNSER